MANQMTGNEKSPKVFPNNIHAIDEEITFKQILSYLLREKKIIAWFTGAGIVISTFFSLSLKPVWKGNLEIVSGLQKDDKIVAEGLGKTSPGGKIKPIINEN